MKIQLRNLTKFLTQKQLKNFVFKIKPIFTLDKMTPELRSRNLEFWTLEPEKRHPLRPRDKKTHHTSISTITTPT